MLNFWPLLCCSWLFVNWDDSNQLGKRFSGRHLRSGDVFGSFPGFGLRPVFWKMLPAMSDRVAGPAATQWWECRRPRRQRQSTADSHPIDV